MVKGKKGKLSGMKKLLWALIPFCIIASLGDPACAKPEKELVDARIILDPGCGGSEPGAVRDILDLKAKDINLDVALRLKELLEGDGAAVAMTRTTDSDKSVTERYQFANEYTFEDGNKADVFVSIHTNSLDDESVDGTAIYYASEEDRWLAMAMHPIIYQALKDTAPVLPEQFTDFGVKQWDFDILRKTEAVSVMVQSVFLSHPEEAISLLEPIYTDIDEKKICEDCRREQIAQAIYKSLLAYFAPSPQ